MSLFPGKTILSVSQLTNLIKGVLEENFEHLWVEGEVSNLALPSSGHLYFTLKDSGATIRCVMFRGAAKALKFRLTDGMRVMLRGRLTVYEQRGDYQLIAEYVEPQGVGALQLAFQQLKERLAREGIFAESRKMLIPLLPQTIGIITSPTGAAIHDILNVIGRRHAELQIIIYPVKVQGDGAAADISQALRDMNSLAEAEVVILARGGGSLEDLWAFNEEAVARAIAASKIPVISAIGHEVDVTIADLVADLRAPTPSAAAELVVNSKAQMSADCMALDRRLNQAVRQQLERESARLDLLKLSLRDPQLLIERLQQKLSDLDARAEAALGEELDEVEQRIYRAYSALSYLAPNQRISSLQEQLTNLCSRSEMAVTTSLNASLASLATMAARLDSLSPLAVLTRGYAIVRRFADGRTISRAAQLVKGESVLIDLRDGSAECTVNDLQLRRT